MAYQLCSKDEYGQVAIVGTYDDITASIGEAKRLVTDDNINNALTLDEKLKNWYLVYRFLLMKMMM